MKTLRFLAILVCLSVALPVASAEVMRTRVGYAYDLKTNALVYIERHQETLVGERVVDSVVSYLDPSGEVFAKKTVQFEAGVFTPDFWLENQVTGHVEGLTSSGATRQVVFREANGLTRQIQAITVGGDSIVDAGFDRFIMEHWSALTAGETKVRPFLVPSRLDFVNFAIARAPALESNDQERAFTLVIDSAWLRWLVSPIEVYYDVQTQRLTRYEGISNLRDDRGDNYIVRIDFAAP